MPLPRPPWRTFARPVSVTAAVVLAHAGVLWALHSGWATPATAPPEAVKVVVELRAQAPSARPAAPAAEASPSPRASAPAATAARAALPERATRPEPPAPAAPLRPSEPLRPAALLPPANPNPAPEPVQPLAPTQPVATAQAPAGAESNPHSALHHSTQGSAAPHSAAPHSAAQDQRSSGTGALDTTAHAVAGRASSGQGQAPAQIVPPSSSAAHLHNPAPPYPVLSRRLGEQGRVLLRVRIEADGSASAAQVYGSSGFVRLDQAAQQAVLRWRFVPGTRNGEPQAMWHLVPIHFVLE